ncbi:MAG: glycosyltransferase family 39 protein [Candidatus Omnitrophica bacterium]|nr:glycosyltransferase family 39 protein [Candidatus Omnitrophota bacterium]
MAIFLLSILFVVGTCFLGYNIIFLFDRRNIFNLSERLGLSYLFGIAAVSLEMFILGIFKVRFAASIVLIVWLPVFILNFILYRGRRISQPFKKASSQRFSIFEKSVFSFLSFEVIYTFFRALMKPVESYDSVAIWSLKAKVLYLAKTVPNDFFHMIDMAFHGIHPDYPLLVPFSEVWFYTFINGFNDYLVKMIFPLNLLAFLLVFYGVLKKATANRPAALLAVFFLASIKQFNDYATDGTADLQMAIYATLTFVFLYMWVKTKDMPYFTACVISCIFSLWTKNEGSLVFMITIALLTILIVTKRRAGEARTDEFRFFMYALLILSVSFAAWSIFKAHLGLENDVININTFKKLDLAAIYKRIIPIAYEYQRHIFGFKKWNLIWIASLYCFAVRYRSLSFKRYGFIAIPALILLSAYTVIYLITPHDIKWHLSTSASRLLIHILPLFVFFTTLNAWDMYNEKEKSRCAAS